MVLLCLYCLCGESRLFVMWRASGRCGMAGSDEDHGRSRRPGVEDWGWSCTDRVLSGRTIERSVTLCSVCTIHEEMRSMGFLVEPQNQGGRFVSGLASKPLVRFASGFTSKPLGRFLPVWPRNRWWRVSRFGPKNWQLRFGGLGLKITATVSWFGPQNHVGYGLSVAPQNRRRMKTARGTCRDLAGYFTWKQVGLGFSNLASRLTETRLRVVHVAPSWRLSRVQAEDGQVDAMGCVRSCYPCFAVFYILGPRSIVVFYLDL
jgi:hypothetical protein